MDFFCLTATKTTSKHHWLTTKLWRQRNHGKDEIRKMKDGYKPWRTTEFTSWTFWLTGFLMDVLPDGNEKDFEALLADHIIVAPRQTTTTRKLGKRKDSYRPWCKTDWILRTYWLPSRWTFLGVANEDDFKMPLANHLIVAPGQTNDNNDTRKTKRRLQRLM